MNTKTLLGEWETLSLIIARTIDSFEDDEIETLSKYAFYACQLSSVNLPNTTELGLSCFTACSKLTNVSIPRVTTMKGYTFSRCSSLQYADLPSVLTVGSAEFYDCTALKKVDFHSITAIKDRLFSGCSALTTVIIRTASDVVTLENTNAITTAQSAIVYVPDDLVDSYKEATNWSAIADKIKPLSELPPEE